MVGKYDSVNVLNNKSFLDHLEDKDAIAEISAMINGAGGNRSQRRKLEKTLSKVEKIQAKCETSARERADKEMALRYDRNIMYAYACIGLVLNEDYHWKEDSDQEHGQITSFLERLANKMMKYTEMDYSTEDVLNLLYDRTGVRLVSDVTGK